MSCMNCGYIGASQMLTISDSWVKIIGTGNERCPRCGGPTEYQQGTYDFVGDVIASFTALGMTREKVERAKAVVQEAAAGTLASKEAIALLREISTTLAMAVEESNKPRIDWSLILTILSLLYVVWSDQKSDADAQALLKETRTQTEVFEKTLEEQSKQIASSRELTTKSASPPTAQVRKTGTKNRHERRKDDALARKSHQSRPGQIR